MNAILKKHDVWLFCVRNLGTNPENLVFLGLICVLACYDFCFTDNM
jgi:hypothetical protein